MSNTVGEIRQKALDLSQSVLDSNIRNYNSIKLRYAELKGDVDFPEDYVTESLNGYQERIDVSQEIVNSLLETCRDKKVSESCEFCDGYGGKYGPAFVVEYFRQTTVDDCININLEPKFCTECGRKLPVGESKEWKK